MPEAPSATTESTRTGLSFLEPPREESRWRDWSLEAVLSIGFHLVLLGLLAFVPADWMKSPPSPPPPAKIIHTTLIAPRLSLQREPNQAQAKEQVSLDTLLSKREPTPPTPPVVQAPRKMANSPAPQPKATAPPPPAPAPLPTPPQLNASNTPLPGAGSAAQGLAVPPPPPAQAQEKPKLAFESVGGRKAETVAKANGLGHLDVPKPSIDEAIRSVAHGESVGRPMIGDNTDVITPRNPLHAAPSQNKSSVELLSDPQGVDFKPYLIQVLTSVRRNWFAVIPESARLGRPGRVTVQFAISRDGKVPKLVIVSPSGTEAFDRAAVAGVSASNPFPPLPPEFHGDVVRLQFSFAYNMK